MQGIRTVIVLSVLLAGVVGLGVWFGLRDPGKASKSGTSGGVAGPAPKEVVPDLPDAPAPKAAHGRGRITGRILLFKTGAPVKDVVVRLTGGPKGDDAAEDISGPDGYFRLKDIQAGTGYEVVVVHGEFAPVRRPGIGVVNGEVSDLGVLFLEREVGFTVRVEDGAKNPVAQATVAVYPTSQQPNRYGYDPGSWMDRVLGATQIPTPVQSAVTGDDGQVEITGLPAGYYSVSAEAEGFARAGVNRLLTPENEKEPVVVRVGRGFPLAGRVLDLEGVPAKGAVLASPNASGGVGASYLRKISPIAEDGGYAFAGLAPGPVSLMVLPEEGVPMPAGTVRIPDLARYDINLGGGGSMEGEVTDPEGEPIAGAEIRAMVRAPRGGVQFAALAITDADGKYRIDGLPAGTLSMFEVLAEGFARYPAPGEVRQQPYLSPDSVVRVDVDMIRGSVLAGKVTAGEGKAVANARVIIIPRSAWGWSRESVITAHDGTYRVEALAPGEYALQVLAEGLYQEDFPRNRWQVLQPQSKLDDKWKVRIEEGVEETKKDLELTTGAIVRGTVEDTLGEPVARARITLSGQQNQVPVFSGDDGAFELTGVTETERAWVYANLQGRSARSDQLSVAAGGEVNGIRLTLKASCTISGRVELQDGGSPRGGTVRAVQGDPRTNTWLLRQGGAGVPVAEDGSFVIEDAPAGQVTLVAMVPGYPSGMSDILNLIEGTDMPGVAVLMERGLSVSGRVITSGGKAIAGAEISIYGRGNMGQLPGMGGPFGGGQVTVAQTDGNGEFVLLGLTPGKFTVTARKEGLIPISRRNIDPANGDTLQLEMSEGGTISGVVTNASGQPVSGMSISLARQGGNRGAMPQATSGSDGTFSLAGVPEGVFTVTAASGWGGKLNYTTASKEGVHPGDSDVNLIVAEGFRITGQIIDPEGKPASGLVVRVISSDGGNNRTNKWALVKFGGSFEVSGLPSGIYTVVVEARGGGLASTQVPNVAAGTEGMQILLSRAMDIEGIVVAPDGSAAANVWVRAEPMPNSPGTRGSGRSVADGNYKIGSLAPGNYRLTFTAPGRFVTQVLDNIPAGAGGVNAQMEEGLVLAGQASGPDGTPASGVTLSANPVGGGPSVRVSADREGKFRFGGLEGKKYAITLTRSAAGYILQKPVTAEAGKEDVKLEFEYGLLIAGSVIDAQGRAISGAWVSASGTNTGARTGEDGTFVLRGVPPGRTTLRLWANGKRATAEVIAGNQSVQIRVE